MTHCSPFVDAAAKAVAEMKTQHQGTKADILDRLRAQHNSAPFCLVATSDIIAEIERLRAGQFRWIPLKEREPTAADGDKFGYVFIKYHPEPGIMVRHGSMLHFQVVGNSGLILAWAQIPSLPERTQEEKDEALWRDNLKSVMYVDDYARGMAKLGFMAGLKAARGEK